MSATVSTPVIAVEVAEKKVRVPTTLPAKYGKFIQFGYFMMNKLNACDGDEDTPPLIDEQVFLNKLRIFEPLEDQQAFVEEFLDSSKQINDELRKMMLQRKRELAKAAKKSGGPKVPPETPSSKNKKSVKTKKTKSDEAIDTDPAVPVEKKSRAKKVKVTSTEDALVNELVQLASGEPQVPSAAEGCKVEDPTGPLTPETPSSLSKKESAEGTTGSPLPPPSKKESAKAAVAELIAEIPKIADPVKETKSGEPTVPPETPSLKVKETKPKAVKESKPKAVKETKLKVAKEEKPKAVKESKPKAAAKEEAKPTVTTVTTVAEEKEEDDEEELQVSIFNYEGQQYLIDDLNNVYDFTSQDKIGTLVNDIIVKSA